MKRGSPSKLALIAILVLASALRLYGLSRDSLWFDEAVVASIALLQTHEIIPTIQWAEKTPPLHYLLVHFWTKLFGASEFSLRLPSVISGVLSVWLIYMLVKRLWKSLAVGLTAALLLAIWPYHIHYSQEARAYSLLVCLSLAATLLFVRAIRTGRWSWMIGYVVTATALLYTHLYGATVIAAHVVAYIILDILRQHPLIRWRVLGAMLLIITLLYSPWLPTVRGWSKHANDAFWIPQRGIGQVWWTYAEYAGSSIGLAVLLASAIVGIWLRPRRAALATLLPLAIVPVIPAIAVEQVAHPIFISRYGIASIGGLLGLAVASVAALRRPLTAIGVAIPLVIAVAAPLRYPIVNPDWRGVGTFLNQNMKPGDVAALTNSNVSILYGYYVDRAEIPMIRFDGSVIPVPRKSHQRVWLILDGPIVPEDQIIKQGNWRVISRHDEFRHIIIAELERP